MPSSHSHSNGPACHCPCGTAVFIGLRALDPLLQYGIVTYDLGTHILQRLRGSDIPISRVAREAPARDLPVYRAVLLAMATGSSIKHILWASCQAEETLSPKTAARLALTNTFYNSMNMLLFTTSCTSPSKGTSWDVCQPTLVAGSALYAVGMLIEICADKQKKKFRRDKKNEGKLYKGGLWGVVRHANYAGYALWRTGFAVAAGGWPWGAIVAVVTLGEFSCMETRWLEEQLQEQVSGRLMAFRRE
jgi:protein-S-isoprenylcysteine O-methyltransferase Ste14